MSLFSMIYRRSKVVAEAEPWFPPHMEREKYISLLSAEPAVPEYHLKTALLRRAMEDVKRLAQLQQEKPALQQLQRQGTIGDDLWLQFTVTEQELMRELQEVVAEANTYKAGWGQYIVTTAAQMLEYEKQREVAAEMKSMKEREQVAAEIKAKRDAEFRAKQAKEAEAALLNDEQPKSKKKGKKH
ncbi:hypothetical protein BZG36_00675 [Bifiguratus adelaidae]|uniref:Uncharacterized protein n=1 Tax=Bifiguratus adelaidae TaxID=1938954 RepID=A0A261Y700_9FUNG|nr:hypothetical protein BZG36_00675 [Bifiguratus adelaidae]